MLIEHTDAETGKTESFEACYAAFGEATVQMSATPDGPSIDRKRRPLDQWLIRGECKVSIIGSVMVMADA